MSGCVCPFHCRAGLVLFPTTKNSPHQSSLLRNQMIYSCLPYSFPCSGSVVVVILFNQRNGYKKIWGGRHAVPYVFFFFFFFFFFWWHFMIFLINRKEKPRGSAHHWGEKFKKKKKGGKSETHCKLFNIRVHDRRGRILWSGHTPVKWTVSKKGYQHHQLQFYSIRSLCCTPDGYIFFLQLYSKESKKSEVCLSSPIVKEMDMVPTTTTISKEVKKGGRMKRNI